VKFVTVRDLRTSPAQVWKALPGEQQIVITNNGKPIALLTPVSDATLEETVSAVRRALAMQAVRRAQASSAQRGLSGMTTVEIDQEIRAARKARARRL
jgi:prevent-host-death family protein